MLGRVWRNMLPVRGSSNTRGGCNFLFKGKAQIQTHLRLFEEKHPATFLCWIQQPSHSFISTFTTFIEYFIYKFQLKMTNVYCASLQIFCRDRNTYTRSRLYQNQSWLKKGTQEEETVHSKSPTETCSSLFSQKTVKLTHGAVHQHTDHAGRTREQPGHPLTPALPACPWAAKSGSSSGRRGVLSCFSPPVKNDDYKISRPRGLSSACLLFS